CSVCSKFATCAPQNNGFSCVCRQGYHGNGVVCSANIDLQPPTGTLTEGSVDVTAFYPVKGYVVTVAEDVTIKALAWWIQVPVGGYVSARIYDATSRALLASGTNDNGTGEEKWYTSSIPFTLHAGSRYAVVMFNPTAHQSPMDHKEPPFTPFP